MVKFTNSINVFDQKHKTLLMRSKLLLVFCLTVLTSNCQNKTEDSNDSKCKELFEKYKEKFSTSDIDSTQYYIESAMKCAPENKNFIDSSIRFYIKVADYKAAIKQIEKLKSDESDKSFDFMISVLKLKMGDFSSEKDLRIIYAEYKTDKQLTSSNLIYKIALDNYFNDKKYTLNQLKNYRKVYATEYDIQNLNAIEELIKTLDKSEVLFTLFNIK